MSASVHGLNQQPGTQTEREEGNHDPQYASRGTSHEMGTDDPAEQRAEPQGDHSRPHDRTREREQHRREKVGEEEDDVLQSVRASA